MDFRVLKSLIDRDLLKKFPIGVDRGRTGLEWMDLHYESVHCDYCCELPEIIPCTKSKVSIERFVNDVVYPVLYWPGPGRIQVNHYVPTSYSTSDKV